MMQPRVPGQGVGGVAMKFLLGLLGAALAMVPTAAGAQAVRILSSRPDTVSDGNALIAIGLPRGASPADVKVSLDVVDVTSSFKVKGQSLIGLVSGLKLGRNKITASWRGRASSLIVTNHDRSGPIFSGPQQSPFICETE